MRKIKIILIKKKMAYERKTPRKRWQHLSEAEQLTRKRKFCKAFIKHKGKFAAAAEDAGVSATTVKYWMKTDQDFCDRVQDIDQSFVDEVEEELFKLIHKGNVYAIMFYLKCKGKDRGYIERVKEENDKDKAKDSVKEYKLDFGTSDNDKK